MSSEETVLRSLLDKPLDQLTEEDISQLTREDCRRYLKEKGMRRPSWNKSQAIQQVISLKKLLEATPDSDAAGARKKLHIPRPDNAHCVPKAASGHSPSSPSSAEETVPCRLKDTENDLSDDVSGRVAAADNDSAPPRTSVAANVPVGQMTIFYCGKVNVYNDVPDDKARALMQLATSPLHLPLEAPFDGAAARQIWSGIVQFSSGKAGPDSATVIVPASLSMNLAETSRLHREENDMYRDDNPAETPANRKASVQRYLEKRKDRFKSKRKVATSSSASLDVYLNHQMGNQTPNDHTSRSDTCSPPQIRPPDVTDCCDPVRNGTMRDNKLSAGLNDKGTNIQMLKNNL